MNYRQIISEAWQYTQKNKSLIRWYGFFPEIFSTTAGVFYIVYQIFAFKKSYLFDNSQSSFMHDVFAFIWEFITTHISWTLPLVIFAVIFAIFYLLFPTIAQAATIQMIARNRNGQNAGVGTGMRYGILSFLQLFEYHAIIKTFGFWAIIIEMAFVLRNLGPVIFQMLMPAFIVLIVISFILTLLFTYADFYIVIDDMPIFQAMKNSAKLVLTNWRYTFLITVLMIIIGVRIIIQTFLVFFVPGIIILATGYIATIALPATSVIIGGSLGLVTLMLAAYLNGIVDIFAYAVWTFSFLALTSEKEVSARATEEEMHVKTSHEHIEAPASDPAPSEPNSEPDNEPSDTDHY